MGDQLSLPLPSQHRPRRTTERIPLNRDYRYPYEPFDAEACLEILQQLGADGAWMSWSAICYSTGMAPDKVSNLCRCLAAAGTLETEDRYYCRDPLLAPDGYLIGPHVAGQLLRAGLYLGFCTAYRLRTMVPPNETAPHE